MDEDELESRRAARKRFIILYLHRLHLPFYNQLDAEGRLRRDRRIPRDCLLHPSKAQWPKLYRSKNDQALITVTGIDHSAFCNLLQKFSPLFYSYSPWTGKHDGSTMIRVKNPSTGRKRLISNHACLALVLTWYRFNGPLFILQGWFGFTGTHISVWLRFSRRILLFVLDKHETARVTMPTEEKINECQELVLGRHDQLGDVFSVCDGLKLHFESGHGLSDQGMYYNGWLHDHYVSNLFVFSVDGRVIMCVLNAPVSIHDSQLADWGNVYVKLAELYDSYGCVCCVDAAFAAADAPYLIRSSENLTRANNALDRVRLEQATSLRQAAEWGMNAIKSAFPRLKEPIKYEEEGERRLILRLVPLLYNYRLEEVGLNQIRNVYALHLSKDCSYYIN